MENVNNGVESLQDNSVSADTFNPSESANDIISSWAETDDTQKVLDVDDQTTSNADTTAADASTSEDETNAVDTVSEETDTDEVSQLLKDTENSDSDLIKKLRQTLSETNAKLKDIAKNPINNEPETPTINEGELLKDLNAYDLTTGEPTTKPFIDKLYAQDKESATRLFNEMALKETENGWTLGHYFLEQNGIDPTRLNDVRKFLAGEIGTDTPGVVPPLVPKEYGEAFKALSKVNQDAVLQNLEDADEFGDDAEAKSYTDAALETLRMAQNRIDREAEVQANAEKEQQEFVNYVNTTVEQNARQTYETLFDTLGQSATFTNNKLSPNPDLDSALKESFLSNLTALGDTDTVLGKRAMNFLKPAGIEVDTKSIESLIGSIEENLQIQVVAEKRGHTAHSQLAKKAVVDAQSQLIALGNKYFVQYANFINKKQAEQSNASLNALQQNAGIPAINGKGGNTSTGEKPLTREESAAMMARLMQEN